jgi:subtilisin family serine protease
MHKSGWRHFAVAIAITIMFLINTVTVAFSPVFLREVEAARDSSANKGSTFQPTQSSNGFDSTFQGKDKRTSRAFSDFWGLFDFDRNTSLDGIREYNDFAVADEDSIELVIGVDGAKPEAYAGLVDIIGKSQGKIVNAVLIKGEVAALVADMPLTVVSSFREEVHGSNLARYTEPNMKFQVLSVPNDPDWSLQWGPQKIGADWAWNTTIGNSSVLVAVIDTGVDWNHPDLSANYVALGYDWVNGDNNPMDDHGHGTHCAGIIAAVLNNSVGIAGLAQVRIMAEKGLDAGGWGTEVNLANAIIHAVNQGATILSNSWGGPYSELIYDAVKYAYNNSVLIVAAAGNAASKTKLYPAACDEVVAVTATDQYDNPAGFTSFGDWVEVAAPGVDIYSTVWDNSYTRMSGTSMACPHAAGVAALIWSRFPNATRDWVRAQLRYTADDLGDSGFDEYYGYGRINAKNAVEQAPPEHDLLIFDWERPPYVKLGELAIFNITVLNFGVNNEADVEVHLRVNDSSADSTSIALLPRGVSTTVGLSWTPTTRGTYNVTYYVAPVPDETMIQNNLIAEMITVVAPPPETNWILLATDPDEGVGANLKSIYGQTYSDIIYFKVGYHKPWTTINDIDTAIFIDADQNASTGLSDGWYPGQYTGIGADYVIVVGWEATEMWKWDPSVGWDLDNPVSLAYLEAPEDSDVFVAGVFLASVETDGIVDCAVADVPSSWDWMPDTGHFTWIVIQYEHEVAVSLETPQYLQPEENSLLNATVYNRGLNNETNVEIHLLINGTEVASETLDELVNGTFYTISYSWTPTVKEIYNITAYAPPVPNENFTINNIKTKFVSVLYPLINPEPGQYANYTMNYYDSSGHLIGQQGYLNLTYEYYIEPCKIYVTVWEKDPSGYIYTGSMIVNTMNRYVESGFWAGLWYPGLIETDINIGSTINLMDGTATVNGTRMLVVGPRAIDCWEIPYSMYGYPYTFWYDKASGLWIKMDSTNPSTGERMELLLTDTNVPTGTQYEHDLGVTLDSPLRLQPGETSMLNGTVYNLGLNNETSVEIQTLINGTKVVGEVLDEIVNGTWHTISYSWTPTTEGIYNITAYASPVSGETVTINNVVSRMVRVRSIEVALISSYSELMAITPILDSMGIGYDIYNDNNMYLYTEDLNLLLKYKAVIFYNRYRWITSTEYSTLESYLSSGGNLLVTGYDCLVSDTLLADLVRSSSTGDNTGETDLYVVDATQSIMNGPYGSFPAGYHIYGLYSDCDMAEADTTRGAVTVAELWDGYDRIVATEGLPGKVVFWNGDGTYDWTWNSDCQAMFKNLIQWFTVRYQHELVVSLEAPIFVEPGDSTVLNATVRNEGLNNETNVGLQLLINGTIVESIAVPQLLTEGSYTISHLWTPTLAGKYIVTVYAPPVQGENITRNNVYSKVIPVQYAPRILAYVQYADYYQDYTNTLGAINSTFGPNYILTELWDYTQLDSLLPGKDILLIPDQEYASLYTMEMIGDAWSETLVGFLENGGIIILCDGGYGYGGTYGILTGAELMSISYTNYRSYYTLYLVDPSDPLAEGVSTSFVAPSYTVSFVTQETNVVIDDGTYPVVIDKQVGRGRIALLGFDFEYYNTDTQQVLGNAVTIAAYMTVSITPSAGSPGTKVTVSGTKATANGTVSIYWDDFIIGNATANNIGDFTYLLTVPEDAIAGVHKITAVDIATGRTASTSFKIILITINPTRGSIGAKITVKGAGFLPESWATVTFNDMLIGYAKVDSFGNFTFTFNIPPSSAEVQTIKALDAEGNSAFATFTVVDVTPLDVKIDVGAMHFMGEIAEFYAQTTFKGQAVNANIISAVLYKPDGTTEYLTAQQVTTGLYKIVYTILGNETGTHTLVIAAGYVTDTVQAYGTSIKCFLVSQELTNTVLTIQKISADIVDILIPNLGTIKANLTAINARLISINGTVVWIQTSLGPAITDIRTINATVARIDGITATIQSLLGVMNGTITSIKNDIATIDLGPLGQIEADISSLKGTQETWTIPQYVTMIMALIAAVTSMLSVMLFLRRRKTTEVR